MPTVSMFRVVYQIPFLYKSVASWTKRQIRYFTGIIQLACKPSVFQNEPADFGTNRF